MTVSANPRNSPQKFHKKSAHNFHVKILARDIFPSSDQAELEVAKEANDLALHLEEQNGPGEEVRSVESARAMRYSQSPY